MEEYRSWMTKAKVEAAVKGWTEGEADVLFSGFAETSKKAVRWRLHPSTSTLHRPPSSLIPPFLLPPSLALPSPPPPSPCSSTWDPPNFLYTLTKHHFNLVDPTSNQLGGPDPTSYSYQLVGPTSMTKVSECFCRKRNETKLANHRPRSILTCVDCVT